MRLYLPNISSTGFFLSFYSFNSNEVYHLEESTSVKSSAIIIRLIGNKLLDGTKDNLSLQSAMKIDRRGAGRKRWKRLEKVWCHLRDNLRSKNQLGETCYIERREELSHFSEYCTYHFFPNRSRSFSKSTLTMHDGQWTTDTRK